MKAISSALLLATISISGCGSNWDFEESESNMDGTVYSLFNEGRDKDGEKAVSSALAISIFCYKGEKPFGYFVSGMSLPTTGRDRTHGVRLKFDANEPERVRLLGSGVKNDSYDDSGFIISQNLFDRMMGAETVAIEFSTLGGDGYAQFKLDGLKSGMEKLYKKGCEKGWE